MKNMLFFVLILISAPSIAQLKPIPSGSYHWSDLTATKSELRESRRFIMGTTSLLDYFEVHASTQLKGAVPRPPHTQTDIEELIFIKEGSMKITLGTNSRILGKGSIILIPPDEPQSITYIGDGALTYYILMFRSKKPMDMERSVKAGGALVLNADSLKYVPSAKGGGIKYMERSTAMVDNLELHITELKSKGPSHAPHTHIDAELILVLEGDTEATINNKTYQATAGDIILINSNEFHGISNSKDAPCKYLAVKWR